MHTARPHADVWQRIWHLREEHDGEIKVEHCKAHQIQIAINKLEPQPKAIAEGNAEADQWAKAGAEKDRTKVGGQQARFEAADNVRWALAYIAAFTLAVAKWNDRSPFGKKAIKQAFWKKFAVPPANPHTLVQEPGLAKKAQAALVCIICFKHASSQAGK